MGRGVLRRKGGEREGGLGEKEEEIGKVREQKEEYSIRYNNSNII